MRGDYSFSPDISWANLRAVRQRITRSSAVQSRFRWILRPGNNLFLVLNRGWYRDFDRRYLLDYGTASAKLQYTFRL